METAQEEKAALLERAVINSSVEEFSELYEELGHVEMSAPALGLACRYRGLEVVKALVQKGASFDFPLTEETEEKYHCYIGQKYDNYRTNYALYLLKVFRGGLKGACCLKGMKLTQSAKREVGKPLPFLADDERVEVLHYLYENREKLSFQPEEMLFYAIYAQDVVIREELRRLGVKLSEIRVHTIVDGGMAANGYWYEYGAMTGKLADKDYLAVMQQLALELDGKPFHFTEKMFDITKKRFCDIEMFAYFLAHFKQEKMNKYKIIRGLIDEGALDALPVIEKEGWLSVPKKRDEMIEYASQNGKTEALAWLLDFKNRTADFAAEQEKAEKKLMRELNMAADSVAALKKIWGYKKREDGTLMITNYKGRDLEVAIPQKIGKSIVTAIGEGAFSGSSILLSWEQQKQRCAITKITLPETLTYIGEDAFYNLPSLKEINIPANVKKIGRTAFKGCSAMESITIPEGVQEIGERAFDKCSSLREIRMPKSVQNLMIETKRCNAVDCDKFYSCTERTGHSEIFPRNPNLVVYCPEGSKTEAYCRKNGISFKNSDD